MRTTQNSLKQQDISTKTMLKKKITTAPNIQNTPLVLIFCLDKRKQDNSIFRQNYIFAPIGKISGFTPIFYVKIALKPILIGNLK